MGSYNIALFGESEKGEFKTAYYCQNLPELEHYLGNPPPNSIGLYFAVQALMFKRNILFFRVQEEGFSLQDYSLGIQLLQSQQLVPHIAAIGLPGVGNIEIYKLVTPICQSYHSILLTTESDLFDYLTCA